MTYGERLGLTKEQYAKLANLRSEYRDTMIVILADARNNYKELGSILSSYPINQELALAKFENALDLTRTLNRAYLQSCTAASQVFLKEQLNKLQILLEQEDRKLESDRSSKK